MTAPVWRPADREAVARLVDARLHPKRLAAYRDWPDHHEVLAPVGDRWVGTSTLLVLHPSGWVLWVRGTIVARGSRLTGRGWRERTAAEIVAAVRGAE